MEIKQGILELDHEKTEDSAEKTIQSLIEKSAIKNLKDLVKENPLILNDLNQLDKFRNNSLINGVLIWLDSFISRKAGLEQISKIRNLNPYEITLQQLIKFYYSYLLDASFIKNVVIYDTNGSIQNRNIQVLESIYIKRSCLTEIAEHSQKYRKHEIAGYLIGWRDEDGKINTITRYIPSHIGGEREIWINTLSMIKSIHKMDYQQETLVGFCHSHPGFGAPSFSLQDKKMHLFLDKFCFILENLKQLKWGISKYSRLLASSSLAHIKYSHLKYIFKVLYSVRSKRLAYWITRLYFTSYFSKLKKILLYYSRKDKFNTLYIPINSNENITFKHSIDEFFDVLKRNFKWILRRFKIKTINKKVSLLPFAGAVICPFTRQFSIIDFDINKKWHYYRVIIKKKMDLNSSLA